MKRIIIIVFIVFTGISVLAQVNDYLKERYHVFKYPNGTISSEGTIKKGKQEVLWKSK